MAEDVGSMEVKGIFRDAGLMIALARVKNDLSGIAHQAKTVTVDFVRLTEQSKKLQGVLGLIGGFSFFGLLASAPRTAAQLERIWLYVKLIFNVIDKNLAPAVKWLADQFENLYKWFKELDPEWQKLISFGLAAAAALSAVGLGAWAVGLGIGFLKGALAKLAVYITGTLIPALTGAAGLSVALGIIAGLFAVWALDKTGVFDFVSKLGKGFRDAADDGNTWAVALRAMVGPFALVGDAILALVGAKSWTDFKRDIKTFISDIDTLTKKWEAFWNVRGKTVSSSATSPFGVHQTQESAIPTAGGLAAPPTIIAGAGGTTTTSNNKETNITNEIKGNTFVMQNGMDVDDFVDAINVQQARSANWRTF